MAHILLVDSDNIICETVSDILISAGHACGWVSNAEEAWELLSWRRPDLLLIEQSLPGMSGTSLLRRLRGSQKFYDLPAMMLTSVISEQDEQIALYNGAQDYIRKPFDPRTLVWKVNEALHPLEGRAQHRDLGDMNEMGGFGGSSSLSSAHMGGSRAVY